MESFGTYLRDARKAAAMTQEALASQIQVSAAYIHQLETGKIAPPTEKRCRQLAMALGADYNELWERAKRERLANWANREGISEIVSASSFLQNGNGSQPLSESEWALIRLIRALDPETRKDFNGLVMMLLRHNDTSEIRETLEEFLTKCA